MAESGITIEQEIAQLEKQLQEKKLRQLADLEQQPEQKESSSDKEVLKQIIGEKIQQHAPTHVSKPASQAPTNDSGIIPAELKNKIQELVNIVFKNSLDKGIKEAVRSKNPALIDSFHDVLVDQLYDILLERKKISPIS